ncbi:MAG: SMP-30/gluconolactonase/LRE family protein [Sphingomonadaceae bacterium]
MDIEIIAEGLGFPEGPVAMRDGSLLVVETQRGRLTRISAAGTVEVVAETGGGPNGAAIGPDGAVYICNNGGFEWHEANGMVIPGHLPEDYTGGSIQKADLATGVVTTLYDQCDGVALRGPNDLVFDSKGGFWFTDFGKSTPRYRDHGAIYYAKADGSHIERVRGEILSPNGIGLSPDGTCLYFADTVTGRLFAIDLDGDGKPLAPPAPWLPGRLIATLPGYQLLDSLKVEANGRICVGTLINGGITVFSPDGTFDHISFPDLSITNLAFGGEDMRDVWATGSSSGKIYRCRWPRPGLPLAHYT